MEDKDRLSEALSPWWRKSTLLVLVAGFSVLIWIAARAYEDAPPIPEKVVGPTGQTIFTGNDILAGQQVFLKYGLMENGTIWGHGGYLGPDFSADYLHTLALDTGESLAKSTYSRDLSELAAVERDGVHAQVRELLKQNRYDRISRVLRFSQPEVTSYERQIGRWTAYLSQPVLSRGLPANYVNNPKEVQQLTAFFAWTAWASVASRAGKPYSYTNNFPYDPAVGNTPTSDAVLWSALSLITLLAGTALILFAFGRFDYLGWKGKGGHIHPQMIPGVPTESQKATIKYFVIVALLFFAQVMIGGATAHYRVDPGSFYGIDLSRFLPSNILRTWHLQLAIFWIATAYVAGGLFLASSLGGEDPKGQIVGINALFFALLLVVVGSLLGELAGIHQLLGKLWFWFGHQGWEYLDLGRAWQGLLALGLVGWLILLARWIRSLFWYNKAQGNIW